MNKCTVLLHWYQTYVYVYICMFARRKDWHEFYGFNLCIFGIKCQKMNVWSTYSFQLLKLCVTCSKLLMVSCKVTLVTVHCNKERDELLYTLSGYIAYITQMALYCIVVHQLSPGLELPPGMPGISPALVTLVPGTAVAKDTSAGDTIIPGWGGSLTLSDYGKSYWVGLQTAKVHVG